MSHTSPPDHEPLLPDEQALAARLGAPTGPPAPRRSEDEFSAAVGRALAPRARPAPWRMTLGAAFATVAAIAAVTLAPEGPAAPDTSAAGTRVAALDPDGLLDESLDVLDEEYLGIDQLDMQGLLALNHALDARIHARTLGGPASP